MSSAAPSVQPPLRMSPEEYLAFDRASELKHEYVNGEVRAMTGASLRHVRIVANVTVRLASVLNPRGCDVLPSDMRVRAPGMATYLFPDITVLCGEAEMADEQMDILLNPTLVVEVLSPSTSDYDRGDKWDKYRRIPSLREYVLIWQDRMHVERYTRQGDHFWLFAEVSQPGERLELESVGCVLEVSGIYDGVAMDGPADAPVESTD
jgi:Uma2 family endonuclease